MSEGVMKVTFPLTRIQFRLVVIFSWMDQHQQIADMRPRAWLQFRRNPL
jgi:hypothetical protein